MFQMVSFQQTVYPDCKSRTSGFRTMWTSLPTAKHPSLASYQILAAQWAKKSAGHLSRILLLSRFLQSSFTPPSWSILLHRLQHRHRYEFYMYHPNDFKAADLNLYLIGALCTVAVVTVFVPSLSPSSSLFFCLSTKTNSCSDFDGHNETLSC